MIRNANEKLAAAIFDCVCIESVGDDLCARALLEVLLADLVGEMHEGVPLVGEHPRAIGPLQDDREVITVLELERREDPKAIEPLGFNRHLLGD